ncbi:TatD family hydrolase [Moellerella wisconsensis]|uniref:Putative deoxyribonuclease n=1 Tax=Moellerella wisconsensis ATCC 35017 TaxID=1354267 RepID=A0A0N0ZBN6_9GAMM|nr:TatD family hydrolase [Moellerella wisconsensis]KPD03426.1 putative deoxyribonuclease [Moellerella wisconsensis ATCC 35017]VFS50762.1 Uncharacterized deoxyribonuclease YjjV [Moellerella wisconsensis]
MFIDTHCHFDFPLFSENIVDSLQRVRQAEISHIIMPAIDVANIDRVWNLSCQHIELYAALGFHPLFLASFQPSHIDKLSQRLSEKNPKCVAVGEIGLDFYQTDAPVEQQKIVLIEQLKLARYYDLPVILHSRKSHDQLAAILRRHPVPATGVVHGFSGSLSQAQAFIKLGYSIGVGGTITYERAQKTRRVIAQLPLSSLLLETDAPDMPLSGFQGEANRPEMIGYVFQTLCELRQEPPEEIAAQLYNNSQSLFNLY